MRLKITLLVISSILMLTLVSCQQAPNKKPVITTDGILKEGQSIPIVTRKGICKSKIAITSKRFRRVTSRDKRRFLYDYIANIRLSITSKWKKPQNTAKGIACAVQIKQRVDGCVQSVKFTQCSHALMRQSVKNAIALASPLPRAPHPSIYDSLIEMRFKN